MRTVYEKALDVAITDEFTVVATIACDSVCDTLSIELENTGGQDLADLELDFSYHPDRTPRAMLSGDDYDTMTSVLEFSTVSPQLLGAGQIANLLLKPRGAHSIVIKAKCGTGLTTTLSCYTAKTLELVR